jgi:hypothetical protein
MSYGTDTADRFREAGIYSGKIIEGTKPADLPPKVWRACGGSRPRQVPEFACLWRCGAWFAIGGPCRLELLREYPLSDFVPGRRPGGQSVFDLMAKGRNRRPISPCVSMCGPAVPSRPVHSPHGLSSSPRRDQFGFGAKSIFVGATAAARAASPYPNPTSSAIATKQRQLSAAAVR